MSVFKWFTQNGVQSAICSNGYEICRAPNAIEWNSTFAPSSALASLSVTLATPYSENDCEILMYVTTASTATSSFLTLTMPTVEEGETGYQAFIQGDTFQASHIYEISIKDTKQKVSVTTTVGETTVTTDYYMISVFVTDLGAQARTV